VPTQGDIDAAIESEQLAADGTAAYRRIRVGFGHRTDDAGRVRRGGCVGRSRFRRPPPYEMASRIVRILRKIDPTSYCNFLLSKVVSSVDDITASTTSLHHRRPIINIVVNVSDCATVNYDCPGVVRVQFILGHELPWYGLQAASCCA
jgi:hypothetical protein